MPLCWEEYIHYCENNTAWLCDCFPDMPDTHCPIDVTHALSLSLPAAVRDSGIVYIFSLLNGPNVEVPMYDLHFRAIRVEGFWLNTYLAHKDPDARCRVFEAVRELMERHIAQPPYPPSARPYRPYPVAYASSNTARLAVLCRALPCPMQKGAPSRNSVVQSCAGIAMRSTAVL